MLPGMAFLVCRLLFCDRSRHLCSGSRETRAADDAMLAGILTRRRPCQRAGRM